MNTIRFLVLLASLFSQNEETTPSPGVMLCGGGTNAESFQWMIEKSGHGDFITIGCTPFNVERIQQLGKIKSIEHLQVTSRELANSPEIVQKIENAKAIFITGGNQAKYVLHWKNTKMLETINARIQYIPIGGTSAGLAVLGEYYYGSTLDDHWLSSRDALANPFHSDLDSLEKGFFHIEELKNTITDSHYLTRCRMGRHLVFMSRLFNGAILNGIGIDDESALCIDKDGNAQVFGKQPVYLWEIDTKPTILENGKPLTWNHPKGIKVYIADVNSKFSMRNKEEIPNKKYFQIINGQLYQLPKD